jgi:hypothetical protein
MATQPTEPEWVSKPQVAKRQLTTAIRLFFERRDPIAVHTLIAAAHQVLTDLGKPKGIVSLVKGGQQAAERKVVNFAANFFKHANKDPEGRINVAPLSDVTAEFLMDAVVMLHRLSSDLPIEAKVYWAWFVTKNRDLFENAGPATQGLVEIGIDPDDYEFMVKLLRVDDAVSEPD